MIPNEKEIIAAVQNGDREAYADLVRAYHGRILRLCQVLLTNPTEAEDAAQEIFLKAYQSLKRFRGGSMFSTWLIRIAHNHCLDLLRKRTRQKTDSLENLAESALPSHSETAPDSSAEILSSLRPEYKEVLALREVSGLTYQEIATNLKCSMDAVKARLRRARRELKEKARHFFESPPV